MLQKTLLSLAVAGTLSASQFLGEVKSFSAKTDAQTLNKEAEAIKKLATRILTSEQKDVMKTSIEAMMRVNKRTYTDFIPTLETSIQKWSKEDKSEILEALDLISNFLDIRLKQYKNMKDMLKNTNIDKILLDEINNMEKMSRNAKKIISNYKNKVFIVDSIKTTLKSVKLKDNVSVNDFWIPVIEDTNDIVVKISGVAEDDFEEIDKVESFLNEKIDSRYINTIMVA